MSSLESEKKEKKKTITKDEIGFLLCGLFGDPTEKFKGACVDMFQNIGTCMNEGSEIEKKLKDCIAHDFYKFVFFWCVNLSL